MSKHAFADYIQDLLAPIGHTTYRAMFGGYGVYKADLIFAIIIDNELYFKASNEVAKIFESAGSEQFTYQGKKSLVKLRYWKVPVEIMEDDALIEWAKLAISCTTPHRRRVVEPGGIEPPTF